ncbi:helix-turn-helix domain-containing protein [Occallatibacter savannae]|uniref:helix-turn-helix domain-containing protein n=1 Tax=Occallatibacter savannae TaxID=1002691 RepID=UPI003B833A77
MRLSGISYAEALRAFQRRYIIEVLAAEGFHLGRTSRQLGVHPNTLTRTTHDLRINVGEIRKNRPEVIRALLTA